MKYVCFKNRNIIQFKVERWMNMRIFHIFLILAKTIQMYSLAILMKYFLKS